MARPQIRESVTVAGRAERARVARTFAVGVLGPGHPCGDDAALLVGELFTSALSGSESRWTTERAESRLAGSSGTTLNTSRLVLCSRSF